jgi:hypothetical protein
MAACMMRPPILAELAVLAAELQPLRRAAGPDMRPDVTGGRYLGQGLRR